MSTATAPRQRSIPLGDFRPEWVTVLFPGNEPAVTRWDCSPMRMEQSAMSTGDYTFRGGENLLRIEKKQLPDAVACSGPERPRFSRERERLLAFPARILIIEASWADVRAGNWRSKVTPAAFEASLYSWIAEGISVYLPGNREEAERLAKRIIFYAARDQWRRLRAMADDTGGDE